MCFFVTKGISPDGLDANVGEAQTVGADPKTAWNPDVARLSTADWDWVFEFNDQKTFMKDLGRVLRERQGE